MTTVIVTISKQNYVKKMKSFPKDFEREKKWVSRAVFVAASAKFTELRQSSSSSVSGTEKTETETYMHSYIYMHAHARACTHTHTRARARAR